MTRLADATVAITGAGGGLGRCIALEVARRGAHVAVSDLDAAAAEETAALCRELGVRTHAAVVDVRHRDVVAAWAEDVVGTLGGVNVIVNNAGLIMSAPAPEQDLDDVLHVLEVDLHGVVHGTQAFLPHLIASGAGHVVNVSSLLGLVAAPSLSAYNAAKFGVRGYTEALGMDLRMQGLPVRATCVHPGGLRTDLGRNALRGGDLTAAGVDALFRAVALTTPERAARRTADAIERDRRRVVIGAEAQLLSVAERLLGSAFQPVMGTVAGIGLRVLGSRPDDPARDDAEPPRAAAGRGRNDAARPRTTPRRTGAT